MKIAYADPPYPGQSARHYRNHPDYAGEVDHRVLIDQLVNEFPDGWALSTSAPALFELLDPTRLGFRLPDGTRIAAWVKPFCAFKVGVNPAYAWEPVIFKGGRKRGRNEDTVRDWVAAPITLQRGVHGAKPDAFCFWLFSLLGMQTGDELADLFPGSGAVGRAWERYQQQLIVPVGRKWKEGNGE
jgi:hypothetical protein